MGSVLPVSSVKVRDACVAVVDGPAVALDAAAGDAAGLGAFVSFVPPPPQAASSATMATRAGNPSLLNGLVCMVRSLAGSRRAALYPNAEWGAQGQPGIASRFRIPHS